MQSGRNSISTLLSSTRVRPSSTFTSLRARQEIRQNLSFLIHEELRTEPIVAFLFRIDRLLVRHFARIWPRPHHAIENGTHAATLPLAAVRNNQLSPTHLEALVARWKR